MKTIEITQYGGSGALKFDECSMSETKAGEMLIHVRVAGMNRPDVFQRTGNCPVPSGVSDIPELEVAGETINGDLTHVDNRYGLEVDDHVCTLVQGRGYAEFCTAPLGQVLSVSAGLSGVETAALSRNYLTVWLNIFDRGLLGRDAHGAGETLLVQGGSSGIRTTAIQIASALGHRVFAMADGVDRCDACAKPGAARVVNYKIEDFIETVKVETGPGIDVVLDTIGGSYVAYETACTVDDGRIVSIILLSGAKAEVPLGDILCHRLTSTGSTLRPCPVAFKAATAANPYKVIWPLLASGRVKPVVHRVTPAARTAQAHALIESSIHISKIMLVWG